MKNINQDYNRNRTCPMCGKKFASGKPRTLCFSCMMAAGLVFHHKTTKSQSAVRKLIICLRDIFYANSTNITGILASIFLMVTGLITDSLGLPTVSIKST